MQRKIAFLAITILLPLSLMAINASAITIQAKAPNPLLNPKAKKIAKKHLGNLPKGILQERSQLEASINSKELFGDSDPKDQRLLQDLARLYNLVKLYDKRTLMPQPSSTLEEPTMINSALGSMVYSVDLSEGIGQRTKKKPGAEGVFLQPQIKNQSIALKLIIGLKTPSQRLSPLRPLARKISKKVKWQSPAAVARIAPVYSGDSANPLKGEFDLNYYAPRPENKNYGHFASTIYLKKSTLKDVNLWHIQILKRKSNTVLKSFVFDAKEAIALAEFNKLIK